MNWLAHCHLARHSDDAILGAVLGDFALGRSGLDRWGTEAQCEILVHRRIDAFTDRHPDVAALRMRFPRRRFAGIALDVYFDHLLAREWRAWNDADEEDLHAFAARVYGVLHRHVDALPPRLAQIAPIMRRGDWLAGYAQRDAVDRAITRIAQRLSRNGEALVECLDGLRTHAAAIEQTFAAFYPQLAAHAARERAALVDERARASRPL